MAFLMEPGIFCSSEVGFSLKEIWFLQVNDHLLDLHLKEIDKIHSYMKLDDCNLYIKYRHILFGKNFTIINVFSSFSLLGPS